MRRFFGLLCLVAATASLQAQTIKNSNSVILDDARDSFTTVMKMIIQSGDRMPEEKYNFKPTPAVRSFGEILGHVADANYIFCGGAKGDNNEPNNEKNAHTKAQLLAALRRSNAYCDSVLNTTDDSNMGQVVKFGGSNHSRLGILEMGIEHANEHYGNIVTYLRLNNLVPPSSDTGNR